MSDMTLEDCTRPWTDAELEALPQGRTMWNPCAKIWMETKDPRADKLVERWSYLHDGRHTTGYDDPEHRDPLDFLHQEASVRGAGVRIVRHPETEQTTAIFPMRTAQPTRQDEDAWEARAQAMHANQGIIELPDPPEEPRKPFGVGVRPSFHSLLSDPVDDVPKFEDMTPAERAKLGHK